MYSISVRKAREQLVLGYVDLNKPEMKLQSIILHINNKLGTARTKTMWLVEAERCYHIASQQNPEWELEIEG